MSTGVHLKTAGDLMRDALRTANITGIEMPVEAVELQNANTLLNDILSWLQTKQIHLWSQTEAVLPLNKNQSRYSLPGDHCFTEYAYTTIGANYIAADYSFIVASTMGMTAGDFIGIELEDGTRWWDTIAVINSSTSLDTTNGAPSSIALNAGVYTYTTPIDQPVRILDLRYAYNRTMDQIPTIQLARKDYYDQPSKFTSGGLNSWYYDRQLSVGYLHVWPVANAGTEVASFTFIKPQYIPEDQTDVIQIPPEWYLALKFRLAADLGAMYAIDANKLLILEQKAASYMDDAIGTDSEFSSFLFYPDRY